MSPSYCTPLSEITCSCMTLYATRFALREFAFHIKEVFRLIVVFAGNDGLEVLDGFFKSHIGAFDAGKDLGDMRRLREELLNATGAVDERSVFDGQFFKTQYRDDVLELAIALEDALHFTSNVVVFLANNLGIKGAGS